MTQLSNHLSENTRLRPRLFQVENSFSIKADEVYLIYERSLTVLRRRLAKMPAIKRPPWAADADAARRLIPLIFVGMWSSALDSDQEVLSEIGAGTREETEKTIADLMVREQSPVWSIGVFRRVVSKVDALYAVHPFVTRYDLERFFRIARIVLSETDPALDLPEENRWAASLYRKTRKHS
jgi:hypothetical protein